MLDELAEKFFINKFYLSKIFKETYGTTVNNYLISKRITRAKQLLRFTDMTVDEVGAAVGMGDANYFSRMFRKVEGSQSKGISESSGDMEAQREIAVLFLKKERHRNRPDGWKI